MYDEETKKMVEGVQIGFDTCLGINDKEIDNQLIVTGDNSIVFTCGSTIVIKDQDTKTQKVICYEKKLRNMTALDVKVDKAGRMMITIGESSLEDSSPVGIHIVYPQENEWKFISCDRIFGEVKKVQSIMDKKQTLALIYDYNDQPLVYLWNFAKDKELGKIAMQKVQVQLKSVCFYPRKQKTFLFFNNDYLKLWDYSQQNKGFVESSTVLIKARDVLNYKFIDYKFMINRYKQVFLFVLCKENKIIWFQNDILKKDIIRLDLSALPVVIMEAKIYKTKDVDESFGFGNVLEGKIAEKIAVDELEEEKRKDRENPNEIAGALADIPEETEVICFTTSPQGFVVAATGGVLCYFKFDNLDKIRESTEKLQRSNPQNYLLKGFKDEKVIQYISVNKNFRLTTLVTCENERLDYFIISEMDSKDDSSKLSRFFRGGFHRSRVKTIGMSQAKSLFTTCGQDDTIRLWSYNSIDNKEKGGLMYSDNKENPLSVSIHPFGFFLAVAFSQSFKVYTLLKENFFLLKEKNLALCNHVQYSDGGQYIISSRFIVNFR